MVWDRKYLSTFRHHDIMALSEHLAVKVCVLLSFSPKLRTHPTKSIRNFYILILNNAHKYLRFEVLMAVTMKISIFWNVTQYSLVHCYQCFIRTYCFLHFSALKMEKEDSSEMLKIIYHNSQHRIPDDGNIFLTLLNYLWHENYSEAN
jgi:hypothetical protein